MISSDPTFEKKTIKSKWGSKEKQKSVDAHVLVHVSLQKQLYDEVEKNPVPIL